MPGSSPGLSSFQIHALHFNISILNHIHTLTSGSQGKTVRDPRFWAVDVPSQEGWKHKVSCAYCLPSTYISNQEDKPGHVVPSLKNSNLDIWSFLLCLPLLPE